MNKREIISQINNQYSQLRFDAQYDYNLRLNKALQDKNFKDLFSKIRNVDYILKFESKDEEKAELIKERKVLSQELLEYISKNQINLNVYHRCAKCKDTGFYDGKMCSCYKNTLRQKLFTNSKLPIAAIGCNLSKKPNVDACHIEYLNRLYEKLEKWIKKFNTTQKQVIFLSGDVGVGKSTLAYSIANEVLDNLHSVYYSTAFDLNSLFLDKQFHQKYDEDAYNTALDSELLIIDDLGTETSNVIGLEFLFNLIQNRTVSKKKTIICTNLNDNQCITRYGERVFSRLTDKSTAFAPSYIKGESLRQK